MKRLFVSALALFLILPGVSHAEKITATGDPWPPFVGPDLPGQGIALKVVRAAFKTQGYEVEMKFLPWGRAISLVRLGKYDVLIASWRTEERSKFLNYSDSYLKNEIKFIKRIDDDFQFNGLESLSGKTVGTLIKYGYGDDFLNANNFSRRATRKFLQNLILLYKKRIDLTLEDEIVAREIIFREAPELKDKLAFTKNALSSNTLHVTSGLKNPKNEAIISAFNKGLAAIKQDGTYDSIFREHGLK